MVAFCHGGNLPAGHDDNKDDNGDDDKLLASGHSHSLLLHERAPNTSLASAWQLGNMRDLDCFFLFLDYHDYDYYDISTYLIQTLSLTQVRENNFHIREVQSLVSQDILKKWD